MKKYFIKFICFLEILLIVGGSALLILFLYNNLLCDEESCNQVITNPQTINGFRYCIGIFGLLFSLKFVLKNISRVKNEVASLILIALSIFLNYFLIATDINIYEGLDGGFSVASIFLFLVVALILLSEKSLWEDLSTFGKFKIGAVMFHILTFNVTIELGVGLIIPVIISDVILSNSDYLE